MAAEDFTESKSLCHALKIFLLMLYSQSMQIQDAYFSEYGKPDDYVFLFLSQNPRKLEHHKLVQSWTAEINDLLKEIAREAGIKKHISTHVARHSFAEVLRELTGNDIYSISAGLGHSSVSITEGYFNKELKTGADKLSQIVAPAANPDTFD